MSLLSPSLPVATEFGSLVRDIFLEPHTGSARLEVPAGQVVHQTDEPPDQVYYLESGEVRVYQDEPDAAGARLIEILGPGQWFGVAALAGTLAGGHHRRAVAVSASVLRQAAVDRFMEVLLRHPEAAAEVIRQLAAKVLSAGEEAAALVFHDCHRRLVNTLLRFSSTAAATRQDQGVVLRITHQQLAQAVGAARETVSLALTQLRHRNLLRTGRNQLFFDPEVLRRFCGR